VKLIACVVDFLTGSCKFVASLYEDQPRYVDLAGDKPLIRVIPTVNSEENSNDTEGTKKRDNHLTLVTQFSKKGDYILSGTNKGFLNVIKTDTLELMQSVKIAHSNIKHLVISTSGRNIVINSSDRKVRLMRVPDLSRTPPDEWEFELEHKFQDVVNRLQWNSIAMSASGEYVLATTYESAHDIYMWETSMGSLVKIYEGPKEELVEIEFHPNKPALVATGLDTGAIYLWSFTMPQKWSALAPDFVELEENIQYEEREDEFDLVDEAEQTKRQLDEEEEKVDVIRIERNRGEYGEDSFVIPISLDAVEEPPLSDDDD
jgi:COMPASS component SWD1